MTSDYTIFIGTVGNGLQVSRDRGESWTATPVGGLEGNVRTVAVYPDDPHRLLAGSDQAGLYRSDDNGATWSRLDSPMEGMEIWSIDVDPEDERNIYVGTRPEGFRSRDGGSSWEALPMGVDRSAMLYPPRTTKIVVDPRDSKVVWAGTEVNGVYRSEDRGDSWRRLPDLGPSPWHQDNHCLAIRNGDRPTVYVTGPEGLATSVDDGETWCIQPLPPVRDENGEVFGSGSRVPDHAYCRGMIIKPDDPDTLFVGTGNTIPGEIGGIQRSRDGGASWEYVPLPVVPNSVVYWLGTHPDTPDVIAAASIFGYVYLSEDGGETWSKPRREFGHVRAVAITPT
ncbi:MAG: hypothetical protein F4X98_03320 [Gammaproteobacteria bacterium]|nr:hypothetical protein [Gammaproteobacteria bacterium]